MKALQWASTIAAMVAVVALAACQPASEKGQAVAVGTPRSMPADAPAGERVRFVIGSESMEPTLTKGATVAVDMSSYKTSQPQPGDLIVFRRPPSWAGSTGTSDINLSALRVIAVGGQTVECCSPGNQVIVDGKPLSEPYVRAIQPQEPFPSIRVPAGTLWVMGDNRNDANDSRYQGKVSDTIGNVNGVVPVSDVVGKIVR